MPHFGCPQAEPQKRVASMTRGFQPGLKTADREAWKWAGRFRWPVLSL